MQQLEVLLRAAIFKPAAGLVGLLLQQAADRLDAAYQPRPGEHRVASARVREAVFGAGVGWAADEGDEVCSG